MKVYVVMNDDDQKYCGIFSSEDKAISTITENNPRDYEPLFVPLDFPEKDYHIDIMIYEDENDCEYNTQYSIYELELDKWEE